MSRPVRSTGALPLGNTSANGRRHRAKAESAPAFSQVRGLVAVCELVVAVEERLSSDGTRRTAAWRAGMKHLIRGVTRRSAIEIGHLFGDQELFAATFVRPQPTVFKTVGWPGLRFSLGGR